MTQSGTHTICMTVREPNELQGLIKAFDLDDVTVDEYFELDEYITLQLEIDSALRVVSGKILPVSK